MVHTAVFVTDSFFQNSAVFEEVLSSDLTSFGIFKVGFFDVPWTPALRRTQCVCYVYINQMNNLCCLSGNLAIAGASQFLTMSSVKINSKNPFLKLSIF